jgi:hypothetical protein
MFLASCFAEYRNTSAPIPFDSDETSRLSELNEKTLFGLDGIPQLSGLNEKIPLDANTTLGLYGWSSADLNKITCLAAHTGSVNANNSTLPSVKLPQPPPGFEHLTIDEDADRFRQLCDNDMAQDHSHLLKTMPPSMLPPIFPHGPLNLNPDGTTINYRKSHAGVNEHHWIQADAEEMARLEAARLEAERKAAEEAARLEAERKEQEEKAKKKGSLKNKLQWSAQRSCWTTSSMRRCLRSWPRGMGTCLMIQVTLEFKNMSRQKHPSCVHCFEIGQNNKKWFLPQWRRGAKSESKSKEEAKEERKRKKAKEKERATTTNSK